MVTAGSFTRDAEDLANLRRVDIELVDGDLLQDMMRHLSG